MKIETTEAEVIYKILPNHDELVRDKNYRYHLFRDCEELTSNKEALFATSYSNNYWKYRDVNGFEHLYNSRGKELTDGIKTMIVNCYSNSYWAYTIKDGSWKVMDNNNIDITPDVTYIYELIVHPNGKIEYKTEKDGEFFST